MLKIIAAGCGLVAAAALPAALMAQNDRPDVAVHCHNVTARTAGPPIFCEVTTSTTPATSSTTPTTAPATTTTTPTSTTTSATASTSTTAPTVPEPPPSTSTTSPTTPTTTTPPTTTLPPDDVAFSATFDTAADFYNRFVTHVGNACTADQRCRPENIGDSIKTWSGDHSMACEGPETSRTVHVADHAELFWHCAPGNDPAKGHVMTSLNTTGYAIVSFSPNLTFTNVRRICIDVNMTDLGGGKWWNMIVVPESEYLRHPNPNPDRIAEREGPFRMDYTTPGFNDEGSVGDFSLQNHDLQPGGLPWGLKNFRGTFLLFHGELILWERAAAAVTTDKAARFRHCIIDNRNGTVTITRNNLGQAESFTVAGAIPSGRVRVIFQDDAYDPPKREGTSPANLTWHWDNVIVE